MDSILDLIFGPWLNAWWLPFAVVLTFPIGFPIFLLIEKRDRARKRTNLRHTDVWVITRADGCWMAADGTFTDERRERSGFDDWERDDREANGGIPDDCSWELCTPSDGLAARRSRGLTYLPAPRFVAGPGGARGVFTAADRKREAKRH